MIFSAIFGAATLIIAISPCAALLPARSIMSAALRHKRRVMSMSIRASAIRSSHTPCSAMVLPMAVRGVVVAEHRQVARDRHSGSVERDENHRLLLVSLGVGIGLAHQDRDLA